MVVDGGWSWVGAFAMPAAETANDANTGAIMSGGVADYVGAGTAAEGWRWGQR